MSSMRKSDDNNKKRKYFRAGTRFFRVGTEWFYTTREGDEGPFESEIAASRHLNGYLGLNELKEQHKAKLTKIREEKVNVDPKVWGNQLDVL